VSSRSFRSLSSRCVQSGEAAVDDAGGPGGAAFGLDPETEPRVVGAAVLELGREAESDLGEAKRQRFEQVVLELGTAPAVQVGDRHGETSEPRHDPARSLEEVEVEVEVPRRTHEFRAERARVARSGAEAEEAEMRHVGGIAQRLGPHEPCRGGELERRSPIGSAPLPCALECQHRGRVADDLAVPHRGDHPILAQASEHRARSERAHGRELHELEAGRQEREREILELPYPPGLGGRRADERIRLVAAQDVCRLERGGAPPRHVEQERLELRRRERRQDVDEAGRAGASYDAFADRILAALHRRSVRRSRIDDAGIAMLLLCYQHCAASTWLQATSHLSSSACLRR
jgi:hypothetical protein